MAGNPADRRVESDRESGEPFGKVRLVDGESPAEKKRTFIRKRRRAPRFGARRGPERNPAYLDYIRTLPCLVCGTWPVEAAHSGPHGMAQKASDYTAVPLCYVHHRTGRDAHHVLGRKFEAHHGIDFAAVTARLRAEFEAGRKAA